MENREDRWMWRTGEREYVEPDHKDDKWKDQMCFLTATWGSIVNCWGGGQAKVPHWLQIKDVYVLTLYFKKAPNMAFSELSQRFLHWLEDKRKMEERSYFQPKTLEL